mgnify:CR=1 FL=1
MGLLLKGKASFKPSKDAAAKVTQATLSSMEQQSRHALHMLSYMDWVTEAIKRCSTKLDTILANSDALADDITLEAQPLSKDLATLAEF